MREGFPLPLNQHFDTSRSALPSYSRITTLSAVVYLPLTLIALVWAWLGDDRLAWELDAAWMTGPYAARLLVSLTLGLALGVVVVAITRRLVARMKWARELHRELGAIVGELSPREITWVALLSGFAEELFFRGAMQPVLGLWLTSLIFGAVHVGPKRVFVVWSLWAFVMGVLLGAIFELTGVLWGAVLAHVWINQRNMRFIKGY